MGETPDTSAAKQPNYECPECGYRKDNEYLLGEIEELRNALRRIAHWPYTVNSTDQQDLRAIKRFAGNRVGIHGEGRIHG